MNQALDRQSSGLEEHAWTLQASIAGVDLPIHASPQCHNLWIDHWAHVSQLAKILPGSLAMMRLHDTENAPLCSSRQSAGPFPSPKAALREGSPSKLSVEHPPVRPEQVIMGLCVTSSTTPLSDSVTRSHLVPAWTKFPAALMASWRPLPLRSLKMLPGHANIQMSF